MPELGHELRWLADQGAEDAQPMAPAQVMRCGDRQRRRRTLRDGFAAVAVTAAVAGSIVSGFGAFQHAPLRRPETGPAAPLPSPVQHSPKPTPTPSRVPRRAHTPSSTGRQPTPTPSRSPGPSFTPGPGTSPSSGSEPTPTSTPG